MWYAKGVVEEEERGSDVGEMTKLSLSLPLLSVSPLRVRPCQSQTHTHTQTPQEVEANDPALYSFFCGSQIVSFCVALEGRNRCVSFRQFIKVGALTLSLTGFSHRIRSQ